MIKNSKSIENIERRPGFKIALLLEIAYINVCNGKAQVYETAHALRKSSYGEYFKGLLN